MTRNKTLITIMAIAGLMSGCASAVPTHLVAVRAAYATSSGGLAAKLNPTELYDAKKMLDKANKEFEEHGDTLECRDYSYIAQRKVELADVSARTAQDRIAIAEAATAGVAVRDSQVKQTQAALASTREQLNEERRDNSVATNELRATNAAQNKELESQKEARLSSEAKLAGAMKDLAAIAAVKEESRGVVITLSGTVLFVTGKHALLNTAMTKLDQVAEALREQGDDKRIVVEGHTDSRGSDSVNQPLSFDRATAVRDYLVSRGVASEKITAVGLGSSKPLTDNKTSESRANNRRVEIIIGRTAAI